MSKAADDLDKASKNDEGDDDYEDDVVDQEEDDHSKNIDDVPANTDLVVVACRKCNKSWYTPYNSSPGKCNICYGKDSSFQRDCLDDAAGSEEIEKVDNTNLLPPINFTMNSNHYFISTSLLRGDNDRSRAKYYSLFVKPDSDTPDGLLMIAKISDSYNDSNKANLSTKVANGILNDGRYWFFPIKFFYCDGNPCFRVKRENNSSILVALKILASSGKSVALWLNSNNSIVIDGDFKKLFVLVILIKIFILDFLLIYI